MLLRMPIWTPDRLQQAEDHHLNRVTAYILASIVEEETTRKEDKTKIASVYLNRISTGMRLSADPTVKFALRRFDLKRVYEKYLLFESPYNTYQICRLASGTHLHSFNGITGSRIECP